MKKFYFEADKVQLEKPTEPLYVSCASAKTLVCADSLEEAEKLASEKLETEYAGSGFQLRSLRLTKTAELPVDWNYGYGEQAGTGTEADRAAITAANQIR